MGRVADIAFRFLLALTAVTFQRVRGSDHGVHKLLAGSFRLGLDRSTFSRGHRKFHPSPIFQVVLRGMSYSTFIDGLKKADIDLNRKQLSELAIHDPAAFDNLIDQARAART